MKFKVHYARPSKALKGKVALPTPGWRFVCRLCSQPCKVTYQDIGPWMGQEYYYEYRSDCCSHQFDEELLEEAGE